MEVYQILRWGSDEVAQTFTVEEGTDLLAFERGLYQKVDFDRFYVKKA